MKLRDIYLRDPFVFYHEPENLYYMTGTSPGLWGFPMYASVDLEDWERLPDAFTAPEGTSAKPVFWAPEIHRWGDQFCLLGTMMSPRDFRGTYIFVADTPGGLYRPLTGEPATPAAWQCLDGTLFEEDGVPWIVFCREWRQVHDGGMWAMPMSDDLRKPAGRPVWLFDASEAPWARPFRQAGEDPSIRFPCYVTDGPFLYRDSENGLRMLWSSFGDKGYAQGVARSESGSIAGPWTQDDKPIFEEDGGHGMLFTSPGGAPMLSLHQPNLPPNERPVFLPFSDRGQ
jgi:hypothetical protein